ncbi:unnamed protein product [Heligmosomoides polygyrus]|uniref:Reverse transcriptase domain-containing protein n=1 Tax=Heligmosomoides polygyrus TaxID=6339 RepID=A0A183G6Q5_HELPZ|nr:unnamed protein product [Heligmosomoides polygyrus]
MDNVDEENDRLVHHLHDSAKGAESLKTTKRRLSPETLELIRQPGAARASCNYQLTSELAKLCRAAIKEDLKERRAEVLAEAAEAELGIRNDRRNVANFKTKMTALRRPDGTVTSSRRTMEKLFSATLENVMRELEWEDMGVKVDGRQLHHLRFADDIVLITPSISQAERMLADFDRVCGNVELQMNLKRRCS